MIRKFWTLGFVLLVAMAVASCGGGEDSADSSGAGSGGEDLAQDTPSDPTPTPDIQSSPPNDAATPEDPASTTPADDTGRYSTAYDPDAVYSMDDVTMQGSYLKINLGDLNPEQLNRVIHRMRSEFCTCGCPSDPIDQCLINDPACGTAVTLTNQIIREEKTKG